MLLLDMRSTGDFPIVVQPLMVHTFQSEHHRGLMETILIEKDSFRSSCRLFATTSAGISILVGLDVYMMLEFSLLQTFSIKGKLTLCFLAGLKTATTRKGNLSPYCTHRRPSISLEILGPKQRSTISCAAGFQL